MNEREISELKLDMLFRIFGISIKNHEEVIFDNSDCLGGFRLMASSFQKDIEIGILNEKETLSFQGKYDNYDVLREVVRILDHVDNTETFCISSERWPILTQRRPFIRTLERRANEFLSQCRYLPDFKRFEIKEFYAPSECGHRIEILMGNSEYIVRVMHTKDLGRGYYSRLVFVLLSLFEEVLEVQEEIDCDRQLYYVKQKRKKQEKEEKDRLLIIKILDPTYYSNIFGLSRIGFGVLPNINLNNFSCATSKALLNSLINCIQSNTFVPEIDIEALEHNINTEFKRHYNRFERCWITTDGFTGNYILSIHFDGLAFTKSIDSDMLYSCIIYILEEIIYKANEMEVTVEMHIKAKLTKIQLNSIYGLGADFDGDTVVMLRGRGGGKSLSQLKVANELLKNGVSKIQIAPGKMKLEKLHNDILDTYRYLYDFSAMKDCTAKMVQYCKSDVDATMRAYLAMKENGKQVVLEQLEEVDPQVPIEQFGRLANKPLKCEPEILINVNKEDKTMMIPVVRRPEIKEVIFNEPATIVFWKDGTKTVVKCGKDDKFDPEKGIAIALAKKMLYSKDYSRVIASSDEWKKAKEAKKKAEAKKKETKKKPMPKLPVNPVITKTSTVKKTTRKGAK